MSGYTKGPWKFETVQTSVGICHKIGPFPWKNGKENAACIYVDYAGGGPIEAELLANTRLIAAAPDLLEALELILETRVQEKMAWSWKPGESPLHDRCRAAIAKARGEA